MVCTPFSRYTALYSQIRPGNRVTVSRLATPWGGGRVPGWGPGPQAFGGPYMGSPPAARWGWMGVTWGDSPALPTYKAYMDRGAWRLENLDNLDSLERLESLDEAK